MRLSQKIIKRLGNSALAMLEENIAAGIDYDGQPYKYSEEAFYRPYELKLAQKLGSAASVFTKPDGKLGMIVHGYKAYKEAVAPYSVGKFLTLSGKMLRNLNVLTTENNRVIIGFSDPELAQRAFWLNVSGAGRGRKLWKFMGLQKAQQDEIKTRFNELAADEIKQFISDVLFNSKF